MTRHHLAATPETIHWGIFDASLSPVLEAESGDQVVIDTVNGDKDRMPPADQGFIIPENHLRIVEQHRPLAPGHILTGPVAIKGAQPGDMLEVRILDVELPVDWGWNIIRPGAGTLPDDFPETHLKTIAMDREAFVARPPWGGTVPLDPFFGVMGLAPSPDAGQLSTIPPGLHGGNLDIKLLKPGATLFLPVFAEGGLFSCGDGHAVQGDGEVCVTAIECNLNGRFEFHLHKDTPLAQPRALVADKLLSVGLNEDLNEAARLALRDMINWLEADYGMSRHDAYSLCSLTADMHVSQLVNVTKGVHLTLAKSVLP